MSNNIYNKHLFVADLVITSLWGLFAVKFTPGIDNWQLAVIPMRILLCFKMCDKSRWTGYVAVMFALAYFIIPNNYSVGCKKSITEMMYYLLQIFDWSYANNILLHSGSTGFLVCINIQWTIQTVWLVLLPIVVALKSTGWYKIPKWCWLNIILVSIFFVLKKNEYYYYVTIWFISSCYLPETYWIIKRGKKVSLAVVLGNNKAFMLYLCFITLFIFSIVIGFRNIYLLKGIGFVCFPAVFYILLAKTVNLHDIPTYDTAIMSVSGMIYYYSMEFSQTTRIVMLITAVLFTIIIAIRLSKISNNKLIGFCLFFGMTVVLCPSLIGMNPYVVTNASHTRLFMKKLNAINGLYVTNNFDTKCGLRDRYHEILPMKYNSIDVLGSNYYSNLLSCIEVLHCNDNSNECDSLYSFYNLHNREFIKIPGNTPIKAIKEIHPDVYALYDKKGYPAFYLSLHEDNIIRIDQKNYKIIEKRN